MFPSLCQEKQKRSRFWAICIWNFVFIECCINNIIIAACDTWRWITKTSSFQTLIKDEEMTASLETIPWKPHTYTHWYKSLKRHFLSHLLTVRAYTYTHSALNLVKSWTITSSKEPLCCWSSRRGRGGWWLVVDLQSKYYASQPGWAFWSDLGKISSAS